MGDHTNALSAEYDYEEYEAQAYYNYDITNRDDFDILDSEGRIINISMSELTAMNLNASFDSTQHLTEVTANSAYMLAFAVLFVIGLLGHSTVLCIASRFKKMRNTATTIYMVNASLGQVLFLFLNISTTFRDKCS